jgi:hypothetical protein
MKDKIYITIIALLTAITVFSVLSHKRACAQLENYAAAGCMQEVHGRHNNGMGKGIGIGIRNELFNLIISGSSDTTLLFEKLEKIIDVQRHNQKRTLMKILSIRDSLQGSEREVYLKDLDTRFCGQNGRGCSMGKLRR